MKQTYFFFFLNKLLFNTFPVEFLLVADREKWTAVSLSWDYIRYYNITLQTTLLVSDIFIVSQLKAWH